MRVWSCTASMSALNEHQVVGVRKVLAKQAELAQAVGGHEMGVVDNGRDANVMPFAWFNQLP